MFFLRFFILSLFFLTNFLCILPTRLYSATAELKGDVSLSGAGFSRPQPFGFGVNMVSSLTAYSRSLSFVGEGQLLKKEWGQDIQARLNEAYLELLAQDFSLALGQQKISWGIAHFFSPADLVSPRDYDRPWNPEKLGMPMMRAQVGGGGLGADLFVAPFFVPGKFPHVKTKRKIFPFKGEQVQFGGRISAGEEVKISLSYFNGMDPFPVLSSKPYHRLQRFGGGMSGRLQGVEGWGEVIYNLPSDGKREKSTLPESFLQASVGGMFSLGKVMTDDDDIGVEVEYTKAFGADLSHGTRNLYSYFKDLLSARIRYSLGKRWSFLMGQALNIAGGDGVTYGEVGFKVTQALRAAAGSEQIFGKKNTPYGALSERSNVFTRIGYSF